MHFSPSPLRPPLSTPSLLGGGRKRGCSQAEGPRQHRAWVFSSQLLQKWGEFPIFPLCFPVASPVLTVWVSKGAVERTSKKTSRTGLGEQTDDGEGKSLPWASCSSQLRCQGTESREPPSPTQGAQWKRATCLHYAAGGWDVLGDADFVAALKKDGSVVIDVQDGDIHSGSPSAPVPSGAVVCTGEKGEGRFGHLHLLLAEVVLSLRLLKITGPTFLN